MHLQRECVLVAKTCTAQRAINSIPFSTPLWSASAAFLTALVPIWSKSITDLNCPKDGRRCLERSRRLGTSSSSPLPGPPLSSGPSPPGPFKLPGPSKIKFEFCR